MVYFISGFIIGAFVGIALISIVIVGGKNDK